MTDLLGALDVGSNTIRLLVARPKGATLHTVLDMSEFVRLGAGVAETGLIEPPRMDRAVRVVAEYVRMARAHEVSRLAAVATSAVREARNGPELIERVRRETGVAIRILSGEEEARLTFLGASADLDLAGPAVTADVGGGSGEVIASCGEEMLWGTALPIGGGRMTESFFRHDPPKPEEREALVAHVHDLLQRLPPFRAQQAVLAGGSARRIPVLLGGERSRLTLDDLDEALGVLAHYPAAQIASRYDIQPARAEVLPAGIQVLEAIVTFYGSSEIIIASGGIREGMIVDMLHGGDL